MLKKKLITFGDSWVWGVGSAYQEGMTEKEFYNIGWSDSENSFREILSRKLEMENLNFSIGGSSNQKQFRLALDTFFGKNKTELKKGDIVLWGITSVYRTELWKESDQKWHDYMLPGDNASSKMLAVFHHNEKEELKILENQIHLWNYYFKSQNVKNYWFNVFNDHVWGQKIENFLFEGSSLLSFLIDDYSANDKYHKSDWSDVDRKIKLAKKMKLVNPYSAHPNKLAHERLAGVLKNKIDFSTGEKVV